MLLRRDTGVFHDRRNECSQGATCQNYTEQVHCQFHSKKVNVSIHVKKMQLGCSFSMETTDKGSGIQTTTETSVFAH